MGSFTLHNDVSKPAVFLAGGIGIAPIRSIIAWATEEKLPHRLYLFYSSRTPERAAFLADFEKWQRENPNFTFISTVTDPISAGPEWRYERGRIDEAMFRKYLPDPGRAVAYVVGPPAMVSGILPVLSRAGFDEDLIRTEEFAGY